MEIDINKLKEAIEVLQSISAEDIAKIKNISLPETKKTVRKKEKKAQPEVQPEGIIPFSEMRHDSKNPRSDDDRNSSRWRESCAYWLKKFAEWGEPLEVVFSREYDPRDYTGFPVDVKVESVDLACVAYREPKVKTLFYTYIYGIQLPSARDLRVKAKQRMHRLYKTPLTPSDDFKKFISTLSKKDDIRPKKKESTREEIGEQFERQLEWEFFKEGFHVDAYGLRKKYEDEGVDLILTKNGSTHLVQAKAYGKGKAISPTDAEVILNQLKAFFEKHKHEGFILGDLTRCILVVANGETLPEETRQHCVKIGLVFKIIPYSTNWPSVKCVIGGKGEKKYYTVSDQHWLGCNMLTDKRRFWATLEEAQVKGYKPSKSTTKKN